MFQCCLHEGLYNVRSCGTMVSFVGQPDSIYRSEPKLPAFRCWNLPAYTALMGKRHWIREIKTITSWDTTSEDKPSVN